jgi:type I restriction enzyme, S subunit
MSFPRYPKYKPSGVEWLGEVPEHWSAGRLRRFARRYSGGTPDKTNLAYWQDGVIPWLNSGAVNDRRISEPSTFITAEAFANSSAKWVPAGALVMALAGQGKTKGMVAQLAIPSTCNQSMAAIVPNPKLDARFLFWWLDSNYQSIRNLAGGDLRDGLNLELVGGIPLPVVPLAEQTAVAEFLDRETAKIDGLVAEQRRLMELLKEKRQAVISHAVTKGLNPHAPMKPSGIEWLGDVPKHWGVWKLTHAFEKIGSGTTPKTDNREYYDDGTHPWVNTGDLNDGDLTDCEKKITDLALSDHTTLRIYPAGSVVIAMYGATIGKLAILRFPASVNQACCVFSGRLTIEYKFLFFWLLAYRPQIISLASGGGQPNVNQDILRGLRVACPALAEQITIIEFLEAESSKFDTLTAEAQRAIDLLQERRTALISAAVTGQIDVRSPPKN